MKVVIRPGIYPPFSSVLEKYRVLLKLSREVLNALSIQVEEVVLAKLSALDKSYYSPTVTTLTPHVYRLGLDKQFNVQAPDIRKDLIWRESYVRVVFIGKVRDEEAVFTLTLRGSGEDRKEYGDMTLHAYREGKGDKFEGFDQLFLRHKLDIRKALMKEVKYMVVNPLSSPLYDIGRAVAVSAGDLRTFLTVVTKYLRTLSDRKNEIERRAFSKLNTFLNLSTLYSKVYSKRGFMNATVRAFEEKGYFAVPGSITIYGDKPLNEGYLNFLEKVIIPLLSEFPTGEEFEKKLEDGLKRLSRG